MRQVAWPTQYDEGDCASALTGASIARSAASVMPPLKYRAFLLPIDAIRSAWVARKNQFKTDYLAAKNLKVQFPCTQ